VTASWLHEWQRPAGPASPPDESVWVSFRAKRGISPWVFSSQCEILRRLRHPRKSPPLDFVRARHGVPVRGGKVGQSSRREAAADPNRSSFAAICGLNPAPGV
jgi:hypothetical protein